MPGDRPQTDPLATIPASTALDPQTRDALTATTPGLTPVPRLAPVPTPQSVPAPEITLAHAVAPVSEPAPAPAPNETEVPASVGLRALLLIWLAACAVGALAAAWSGLVAMGTGSALADADLLLAVVACGALGGTLHALGSLAIHAGRGSLRRSWWLYYLALPLGGGLLAAFVWLLQRGGLLGLRFPDGPQGQYGALAWAALTGLFASLFSQKLRDAVQALFRPGRPYAEPPRTPAP